VTVAELRERTLRQIEQAAREVATRHPWDAEQLPCPTFVAAIRALPDATPLAQLAPEMRTPIEQALLTCSDHKPASPRSRSRR
jgi:hypothetical protein